MAGPGKERKGVRVCSLLCFWTVKELGISLTDLGRRLGISVPTVSGAIQRGRQIVERERLEICAFLNVKI
jgi:putative transposase